MTQVFWSGSYTSDMHGTATGIGALARRGDGTLRYLGTAVRADSPSFLAPHPLLADILYATLEGSARLEAFRHVGETTLKSLGSKPAAGPFPCHTSVAIDGRTLFSASYGDGSVGVSRLAADGSLREPAIGIQFGGNGPHPNQDGAHAHTAQPIDAATLVSLDLGTDEIRLFDIGEGGALRLRHTTSLPPGSGPRDLVVHPSGLLYVLTELSNEVFVLERSADHNELAIVGSTRLGPELLWGTSPQAAGLSLSGNGRFVHAGVRGANVLVTLAARDGGRRLEPVSMVPTGGDWPRHHLVDGAFLYVCNQLSSSVTSFALNARTGIPEPIGQPESVPSPTFLLAAA